LKKRSGQGFSLIELVVVLAILLVLMAALLPIIGPLRRRGRLNVASSVVAGALRTARSMAIARSAVYSVEFETAGDLDEARIYSGSGSKLKADLVEQLPRDHSIYSCTPATAIRFDPDGTCRGTYSIKVRSPDGREHTVTVSAASGYVKVTRVVK
jgi:prepilin-type N-terminal cleavage/methylation domain-containing protein